MSFVITRIIGHPPTADYVYLGIGRVLVWLWDYPPLSGGLQSPREVVNVNDIRQAQPAKPVVEIAKQGARAKAEGLGGKQDEPVQAQPCEVWRCPRDPAQPGSL